MRVFFAIDDGSTVNAEMLRQLLVLQVPRETYEVLPLARDRFPVARTDIKQLLYHASLEGKKVVNRYDTANRCVVIVGALLPNCDNRKKKDPIDYVVIVQRGDDTWRYRALNPKVKEMEPRPTGQGPIYWQSSPDLQPDLLDTAILVSGLQPTR